jgi:hypothetical protein
METRKILGIAFVCISMLISLANILSVKMTGAVVGVEVKSSLLIILSFVFFFVGLLLISRVGKGLAALVLAGSTIYAGHKIHQSEKEYKEENRAKANVENVETVKITAPYWKDEGRFQRTYRWDKILDETEDRYELPKGILKGLAMQESYGDPLRLNMGKDGGAGLFMFQPRTAKNYGLKVYGKSDKSSADTIHGLELKGLIKINKYDYTKMAKIDERFDIRKSAEAAARYLRDDYKRYKDWDKTLSAYNQGRPAPNAKDTEHVKKVTNFQEYYNQRDKRDHKYIAQKVDTKGQTNINKKGRR